MTVPAADDLRRYATPPFVSRLAATTAAAIDLLYAIDALHQSDTPTYPDEPQWCLSCGTSWPCETARLLHGEDQ